MGRAFIPIAILILLGIAGLILVAGTRQPLANRSTRDAVHSAASTVALVGNAQTPAVIGMDLVPTAGLVPLGGSANFTLIIRNGDALAGNYSLTATGPTGLSFEFASNQVSLSDCVQCYDNLLVSSSSSVGTGTYKVTIEASGPDGLNNHTFDFQVQRNLVLLSGNNVNQVTNLTLKAGDSVMWVCLDGPFNKYSNADSYHEINFLNSTITSGLLDPNQQWSYTFKQPGVYQFYDSAFPTIHGIITVVD